MYSIFPTKDRESTLMGLTADILAFCEVVLGTTSPPIVGLLIASGSVRTSGSTTSGSGWCVLLGNYWCVFCVLFSVITNSAF